MELCTADMIHVSQELFHARKYFTCLEKKKKNYYFAMGNIMHRSNVPCVDAAYVLHVNWRYLFLNATFRLNLSTFFKHF